MMRYILREYFHKILLSARFLVTFVAIFAALTSVFLGMQEKMGQTGYRVGAFEMLPAFLFYESGVTIYFGIFIFLIAVLPKREGSMNQIMRMGKRKWLSVQYIYVFLSSVIYHLVWTLAFIVALFPRIIWENKWSSLARLAVDPQKSVWFWMDLDMNVPLQFSELLTAIGSPLKVYLLDFFLVVCGSTLVGILMVTFNIYLRRGVGTVAAFCCVGVRGMSGIFSMVFGNNRIHFEGYKQVKNLLERMQYYISPLYQSDLFTMAVHNARPVAQRVEIGAAYFAILITLTALFGMWIIRKIDLCKETE